MHLQGTQTHRLGACDPAMARHAGSRARRGGAHAGRDGRACGLDVRVHGQDTGAGGGCKRLHPGGRTSEQGTRLRGVAQA